jgi:hypothetical protein
MHFISGSKDKIRDFFLNHFTLEQFEADFGGRLVYNYETGEKTFVD